MILPKHLEEPAVYGDEEIEAVDAHIKAYFGEVETVSHELISEDIHVDISMIKPHDGHDYYTLATTGMGAYAMNIPDQYLSYGFNPRAELIICLPPEWDPKSKDQRETWPLDLLRYLARFAIVENTWLAFGHTVDNGAPYTDNTLLSGCILLGIQDAPQGAAVCNLPDGNVIAFYQVIPLTKNELSYKVQHNADEMLSHMKDLDHVVYVQRPDTDFA